MMNSFTKQPSETYSVAVDFDGKLPTGASPSTGVVALFNAAGTDLSSTMLSGTGASINNTQALIRVLGGVHGQDYRIRFRVTLTNSDVLEEDVLMHVENL